MNIIIINSPIETAIILDPQIRENQLIEVGWMIDMAEGRTKETSHLAYQMYKPYVEWLKLYKKTLEEYKLFEDDVICYHKHLDNAYKYSAEADAIKPEFMCKEFYIYNCQKLFDIDKTYYLSFEKYGPSSANYYFIDGKWRKYVCGEFVAELENLESEK